MVDKKDAGWHCVQASRWNGILALYEIVYLGNILL